MVEKLGLRREGYYERFLDIDGAWRDHAAFAITYEELGGRSVLSRLTRLPPAVPEWRSPRGDLVSQPQLEVLVRHAVARSALRGVRAH